MNEVNRKYKEVCDFCGKEIKENESYIIIRGLIFCNVGCEIRYNINMSYKDYNCMDVIKKRLGIE